MRRTSLSLAFILLTFGCDGGPPGVDGGAAFDVVIETAPGVALEDGGTLGVHYGCQGGAHTFFSVVATGDGLDGARLVADLRARRVMLEMMATPSGAEYRDAYFLLADRATPGELNGMTGTLTVTVLRSDGANVVVQRQVVFQETDRCTPMMCMYAETQGTAHITGVDGPMGAGCTGESIGVHFDFTPTAGGTTDTGIVVGQVVPPECVDTLGIVVDGAVPAIRADIVPGTGTCTPRTYRLALDTTPCDPICPP